MTIKKRRAAAEYGVACARCIFTLLAVASGGAFVMLCLTLTVMNNTENNNSNNNNNNTLYNNTQMQLEKLQQQQQLRVNNFRLVDKIFDNAATSVNANANSNTISTAGLSHTFVSAPADHHNDFDDQINISNQRNVFNERPKATSPPQLNDSYASAAPRNAEVNVAAASSSTTAATSSYFERIERMEAGIDPISSTTPTTNNTSENNNGFAGTTSMQQPANDYPWQEHQQQQQLHPKLLLHRRKRYLVFPEGSSFQLVFDLIIPIVDYTNFAIMGITCAVAWELPSKPPSEILENFRDKLNDGTYGLSRRNDTIGNSNTNSNNNSNSNSNNNSNGSSSSSASNGIKYVDKAQIMTANADGLNSAFAAAAPPVAAPAAAGVPPTPAINYGNVAPAAYPMQQPARPATTTYYYYAKPAVAAAADTATADASTFSGAAYPYEYTNDAYGRRKNYLSNSGGGGDGGDGGSNILTMQPAYYAPLPDAAAVAGNDISSASGYASSSGSGSASDKQHKFAAAAAVDWWQPHNTKWQTWQDYKGGWQARPQQQQQWQRQQQQKPPALQPEAAKYATTTSYAGAAEDNNWWQRNKQRVQDTWRSKQYDWQQQQQRSHAATFNSDTTRNYNQPRPVLSARPQHRIYPVFGRRRRRQAPFFDKTLDAFELRIETLHFREQLQSRQRLYGKIERLFRARKQNGTACVLRALCETGQRQRPRPQRRRRPPPRGKRRTAPAEPESFVTELLRAIFTLPTSSTAGAATQSERTLLRRQRAAFRAHISMSYRMAYEQRDGCARLFASCEHSIWFGERFRSQT